MSLSSAHSNRWSRTASITLLMLGLIGLAGCATRPMSPTLVTLPGTGRSFDQFRADDYNCRLYGEVQIGLRSAQSAAAAAMPVGTSPGSAGGTSSTGFIGGGQGSSMAGATPPGVIPSSNLPAGTSYEAQQRYDNAYIQCMYASGNRVPVYDSGPRTAPVATQPSNIPQPPAGPPPLPPPGLAKPVATPTPQPAAPVPAPSPARATPPQPPPGPAPAPPPSVRSN